LPVPSSEESFIKIISTESRALWLVREVTSSAIFSASLRTGINTVMGEVIRSTLFGRRIVKKLIEVIKRRKIENMKSAVAI
jgi:hypothetical protein